jgi:hypothetical protein
MQDRVFARSGGAAFGGIDIRPLETVSRMWAKSLGRFIGESGRLAGQVATGRVFAAPLIADAARWQLGWWASLAEDPKWHARWMADTAAKWVRLGRTVRLRDPRSAGPPVLRTQGRAGAQAQA